MAASEDARRIALVAAQAAADKKAHDLVLLDVSEQLIITDCFVIASAPNERQVDAIVESVEEKMRAAGHKPVRREGEREGRWILLDFVDVVVHIQHVDERAFYELERLWKDCPRIDFEDRNAGPDSAGGSGSAGGSENEGGSDAEQESGPQ
ncbi:ribosome silencing factor [Parasphingorhabdus pacifica]